MQFSALTSALTVRLEPYRKHGLAAAQFTIIVAAGVAISTLVLPPVAARVDLHAPAPDVVLCGERFDVGAENAPDRALEIVRHYAAGSITLTLPGGRTRSVARAALGATLDRAYLASLLAETRDPTSPLRREHSASPGGGPLRLPTAVVVDAPHATATLLALKDELDALPSDARLDLASRKLVPEVAGYRLDVYATLARLDEVLARGDDKLEASVERVEPNVAAAQLGNVAFDEVLGFFETHYATDRDHEARTFNLRLAASRLDGHVLPPGEVFDFNQIVGPRNEAAGYKVAPVIAQGELVDGIGGGTCQITGTLHGAVFFAGLEVVNRTPHTRPSAYIKMGLDAAVAYPTINFKFRNNFSFPVVVHETVKDGIVRAEVLGPRRTHTVTFVRKIDEVVPFQEVERPDTRLPEGAKVLAQRGIPGFKLHRYRIAREGPFAVRERWNDSYPPTNQIIRVGSAADLPKDMPLPADDAHPEYIADDYMTITQGPDARPAKTSDASAMVETREPGRTGETGWTQKAGMSHWEPGKQTDETSPEVSPSGAASRKERARSQDDASVQGDETRGERRRKRKRKHDGGEGG